MTVYEPVDPKVDLPEVERQVLELWRERKVFERSMQQREGAPEWTFYEGPPTANGLPGLHHVESRTFKDIYPRYRTMTGHFVRRKAGWDCHGLPVEIEVEKQIGTKTKRDIEEFGIAEFNKLCRESVQRYVAEWGRLTERIGFWIDLDDAYWTMDPQYIESVWWALKTLHGRGLLFEDHKSVAYCPRCGTPLSDAEVALGYEQVEDPSVYVRLPVTEPSDPRLAGASLLIWTTTPWTLPSNLGAAVDPGAEYQVVDIPEWNARDLVVASGLPGGVEVVITERLPGSALVGTRYAPPYENLDGNTHRVVAADFVVLDEGTGIVHIAPGYGSEDLALGRREGWPVYNPMDGAGRFTSEDSVPEFVRGRFVKDADPDITADLEARGLLVRAERYVHTYPLCWRCSTPLLYVARTSWYVRTTAMKDRLLEVNESVNWFPDHIKHGRYGNWLENNVDWALSRERYWGTPLPLWRCAKGHVTAVGSLKELSERAGRDVTDVDPHRPAIDEIAFVCPECGEEARRVPEVIDTWYDSGAMPYAQWGYHPDLGRGVEEFAERFPADFIAEAIDQTRGWFYTLMAEGVLLCDSTAYRNVVCLGLLVDREGRKMSKSVGNVIDPWTVIDRQGADALRWFLIAGGSPWASRRVSLEVIDEVVRQLLLTLWNVYAFHVTYANADGVDPDAAPEVPVADRPPLDRWILSRLHHTIEDARTGLDAYDATGAGRRIARFLDDLSNWYVRRARRRFWSADRGGATDEGRDKAAATRTLHECLVALVTLMAPFTPFVSERIWQNLAAGRAGRPDSVHLADYPVSDPSAVDDPLEEAMGAARTIVALGRQVRTDTKVKVRQPLSRAVVHYAGDHEALRPLLQLVTDELNVKEVEFAESAEQLAGWRAKPNFRTLGPRLGARVKEVAARLTADHGRLAAELAAGREVAIALDDGEEVSLGPPDVDLSQEVREGWGVAAEGGMTVALDLELDEELRLEGLARELVRVVQDARKAAGLDVTDRIRLHLNGPEELARALDEHSDYVATETLAVSVERGPSPEGAHVTEASVDGLDVVVAIERATG